MLSAYDVMWFDDSFDWSPWNLGKTTNVSRDDYAVWYSTFQSWARIFRSSMNKLLLEWDREDAIDCHSSDPEYLEECRYAMQLCVDYSDFVSAVRCSRHETLTLSMFPEQMLVVVL